MLSLLNGVNERRCCAASCNIRGTDKEQNDGGEKTARVASPRQSSKRLKPQSYLSDSTFHSLVLTRDQTAVKWCWGLVPQPNTSFNRPGFQLQRSSSLPSVNA